MSKLTYALVWSVSANGKLVGSVIAEDAESSLTGRFTAFESS